MKNGDEVNLHIGARDWNAQCALVEDTLHEYYLSTRRSEDELPSENVLSSAYCVRTMRDNLLKMEEKIDQLVDENTVLAHKVEVLTKGLELMEKECGRTIEDVLKACMSKE